MTEHDAETAYQALVTEDYGSFAVHNLTFGAGRILRELDPIAFREGMLNWADANNIEID